MAYKFALAALLLSALVASTNALSAEECSAAVQILAGDSGETWPSIATDRRCLTVTPDVYLGFQVQEQSQTICSDLLGEGWITASSVVNDTEWEQINGISADEDAWIALSADAATGLIRYANGTVPAKYQRFLPNTSATEDATCIAVTPANDEHIAGWIFLPCQTELRVVCQAPIEDENGETGNCPEPAACPCTFPQVFDPESETCVCPPFPCADGLLDNSTCACLCPPERVLNDNGTACVCGPVACEGGFVDECTCSCTCPAGTELLNGTCTPTTPSCDGVVCNNGTIDHTTCTCVCPDGWQLSEDNTTCTPPNPCEGVVCNNGTVDESCACVCADGYELSEDGTSCVIIPPPCEGAICTGGTINNETCACECPDGYQLSEDGTACEQIPPPGCNTTCNHGTVNETTCECECPPNRLLDGNSCVCSDEPCPEDFSRNPNTCECEPDEPTPNPPECPDDANAGVYFEGVAVSVSTAGNTVCLVFECPSD